MMNAINQLNDPQKLTPIHDVAGALGANFGPLAGWQVPLTFAGTAAELDASRRGVVLADQSANGKMLVEGQEAEKAVQAAWSAPALAIGEGVKVEAIGIFRLRADLFFISTAPGGESGALARLAEAIQEIGSFVTATDITHGRSELRLVGPEAPVLLSRLCGLDFDDRVFPNMNARQSRVAKTNQIIIRNDIGGATPRPAYTLVGGRSLGAYVWRTILEAGHDLQIAPLGQTALEQLSQSG